MSLEDKLEKRLKAAKFRLINQKLYNNKQLTRSSISFYHNNYQKHTSKWPSNPINKIIQSLNPTHVIADLGCGDSQIASTMKNTTVHSFDQYPINSSVIKCDIKKVPLGNESVDSVVFCLSLMSRNVFAFIKEANRILKNEGMMYIAEVKSRVDIDKFITLIQSVGFKTVLVDKKCDVFFVCEFKKIKIFSGDAFPIYMRECEYKKR